MKLDSIIASAVAEAVKNLYGAETPAADINIQATPKNFEGNLTVVVFPWVKLARKAPVVVAQ